MSRQKSRRWLYPRLEVLESREVPAIVGGLDPSFGTGGKVSLNVGGSNLVIAEAVQADGKIVVAGTATVGEASDFLVVRFNPDGTQDMTFNAGTGKQVIDLGGTGDGAYGVAIQGDGKIVAVGRGGAGVDFAIVRLNADGTPDGAPFLRDLGGSESAAAVGLQSDGSIVVAGLSFSTLTFAVIRLKTDLTFDASYAGGTGVQSVDFGGFDNSAIALAVYKDSVNLDKVVVVGQGGAGGDFAIVRLGKDGAAGGATEVSTLFNLGGLDAATGVAIAPDGKVVVGGFTSIGGLKDIAAIRVNPDLVTLDTTFNPTGAVTGTPGSARFDLGADDRALGLALDPLGRVVLVGASNALGTFDFAAIRVNTDGSLDTTFNSPGAGKVFVPFSGADRAFAVALDAAGRVVLAGSDNNTNLAVVRLIGTVEKVPALSVGGSLDGRATAFLPNVAGTFGGPVVSPAGVFPSFAGNVRSANGDINGDGNTDVILVTSPGTPIRFAVVSGADNATLLIPPTAPFVGSEDFAGGGFVASADLDHDGRAEIIFSPDQGGGPRVTIFSRNTDGTFAARANFFGIDDDAFRGGCRLAMGDVNGDGTPDMVVCAGFLGGPRAAIFEGTTLLSGNPTRIVNDFFAFPGTDSETLRNGVFVAAGDVNGDGFADLIFGGGPGGAPRIFILSGQQVTAGDVAGAQAGAIANFFVAGNISNRGGVRLAAKDADGDNHADVAAGSGEGSPSRIRVYLGKNFTSPGEPSMFQDLDPFGGAVLADGVFVG